MNTPNPAPGIFGLRSSKTESCQLVCKENLRLHIVEMLSNLTGPSFVSNCATAAKTCAVLVIRIEFMKDIIWKPLHGREPRRTCSTLPVVSRLDLIQLLNHLKLLQPSPQYRQKWLNYSSEAAMQRPWWVVVVHTYCTQGHCPTQSTDHEEGAKGNNVLKRKSY